MKSSIVSFFIFSTLALSFNAFAISDADLANKCLETGKAKIASQAEAWGCKVDLNQVEIQEVDNRWYNPSKYVNYQVLGECNGFDRVVVLVQYYKGKCF